MFSKIVDSDGMVNVTKFKRFFVNIAKMMRGIEANDEEFELNLVDMSKKYNMELDKLKELISDEEKENMRRDMAMGKTVEMLVNNAVVK